MADKIIIMADIIESRQKEGAKLMDAFRKLIRSINKEYDELFLSPLTITLGDEFQGVTDSLRSAVETIFRIEESIIERSERFKLRYVVYEGKIDTSINRKSAHGMLGEGLTKARETLNVLKEGDERIRFKLKEQKKTMALNKGFYLYQWIVDEWKDKDYPLIKAFWKFKDYKKVASHLDKNVSLMWKREQSLRLKEYESIKHIIQYLL